MHSFSFGVLQPRSTIPCSDFHAIPAAAHSLIAPFFPFMDPRSSVSCIVFTLGFDSNVTSRTVGFFPQPHRRIQEADVFSPPCPLVFYSLHLVSCTCDPYVFSVTGLTHYVSGQSLRGYFLILPFFIGSLFPDE